MKTAVILINSLLFVLVLSCGTTQKTIRPEVVETFEASINNDDDFDGIKNEEDECPYIFGTARTKGCPDSDLDGVRDSEDPCPDTKGYANLSGCYDRDFDGVIDPEDKCPDVFAQTSTGCPGQYDDDLDGDGVKNVLDKCKEQNGFFTASGCFDLDGDGIVDKDDRCPDMFGLADYDGCPVPLNEMLALSRVNGHPEKAISLETRGYYRNYDGKLYDRFDKSIDIVAGDITDAGGNFVTESSDFRISREGYILNSKDEIVKIDEEGFVFGKDGLLSELRLNNVNTDGGISFGAFDGPMQNTPTNYQAKTYNYNQSSASSQELYDDMPSNQQTINGPDNFYEKPLTKEEQMACDQTDMSSLSASIYFDQAEAIADRASLEQLDRVVEAMKSCPRLELQVAGHADSDGGEEYNFKLSERRAKSILRYFVERGISDIRLKFNAYGEKYPKVSNRTDDGKQKNRRADIKVLRIN